MFQAKILCKKVHCIWLDLLPGQLLWQLCPLFLECYMKNMVQNFSHWYVNKLLQRHFLSLWMEKRQQRH